MRQSVTQNIIQQNASPPKPGQPEPPKDFMKNLIDSFNNATKGDKIQYTGNPATDTQNLSKNLDTYVRDLFYRDYDYPYSGRSSRPPRTSDPKNVNALDEFTSCPRADTTRIRQYLQDNVAANLFKKKVREEASADLFQALSNLLRASPGYGWNRTVFSRVYEDENKQSYTIDGSFVWTLVEALNHQDPPQLDTMLFLTFVGTAYKSK